MVQKLPLENALEDSPETRLSVAIFEHDTSELVVYMRQLWRGCQRLVTAQQQAAAALRDIAAHLRAYPTQGLLDSDLDASIMKEFSQTMDEMGSWHQALGQQLAESMAAPIHRYIDKELQELFTVGKLYQSTADELDQSLSNYARSSSRAKCDVDSGRTDSAHAAYVGRKKFHQIALLYFNKMNLLQHSRKVALIDPLLGLVQAYRSFHSMGNGTLNAPDTESFLSTASHVSQSVQSEIGGQMSSSADLMDSIISRSEQFYPVTSCALGQLQSSANATANTATGAHVIAGYLFHKARYMGVMSQWERCYFFVDDDCSLMMTRRAQLAACVCLELDASTIVQPLPAEERHAVFQISTNKKSVILQALNEHERDAWLVALGHFLTGRQHASGGARERSASHTQTAYAAAGSILSGVSQFFVSRRQQQRPPPPPSSQDARARAVLASAAGNSRRRGASDRSSLDASDVDMPVMFELGWPECQATEQSGGVGAGGCPSPPLSPFDEQPSCDQQHRPAPFVGRQFEASFLGSLEVPEDRGHQLVAAAVTRVLTARQHSQLPASPAVLLEPALNALLVHEAAVFAGGGGGAEDDARRRTVTLPYSRLSFWAAALDSERLMGVIAVSERGALLCHVFETRVASQQVCSALTQASVAAFRRRKDAQLLLQNISLQPDVECTVPPLNVAADGDDSPSSSVPTLVSESDA